MRKDIYGYTIFPDLIVTFKRLLKNKTLILANLAEVLHGFGYMAYFMFFPKYIEIQYRQSASIASLITGTVGLVFTAFGILIAGLFITKYQPNARYMIHKFIKKYIIFFLIYRAMAAWIVQIGVLSVLCMISFVFLGCPGNDKHIVAPGIG